LRRGSKKPQKLVTWKYSIPKKKWNHK
jgi:hypothetical protein